MLLHIIYKKRAVSFSSVEVNGLCSTFKTNGGGSTSVIADIPHRWPCLGCKAELQILSRLHASASTAELAKSRLSVVHYIRRQNSV